MVDSLIDTYIKESKVYQDIESDSRSISEFLRYGHESIIAITEKIEDILISLAALEIDKGIHVDDSDFDDSIYAQTMFVNAARLCSGPFAADTLTQYLLDCRYEKCQLAIAHQVPYFYNSVCDKDQIYDSVKSYLTLMEA